MPNTSSRRIRILRVLGWAADGANVVAGLVGWEDSKPVKKSSRAVIWRRAESRT